MKPQKEAAFPKPENPFYIWNSLGNIFPYAGITAHAQRILQRRAATLEQTAQSTGTVATPWETARNQAVRLTPPLEPSESPV